MKDRKPRNARMRATNKDTRRQNKAGQVQGHTAASKQKDVQPSRKKRASVKKHKHAAGTAVPGNRQGEHRPKKPEQVLNRDQQCRPERQSRRQAVGSEGREHRRSENQFRKKKTSAENNRKGLKAATSHR
jgi:hypothetical protein